MRSTSVVPGIHRDPPVALGSTIPADPRSRGYARLPRFTDLGLVPDGVLVTFRYARFPGYFRGEP